MATIIDALLVTLGLDDSNFKKGVQNVTADTGKINEAARKTSDGWEQASKTMAAGFSRVRNELVGTLALILGVGGLKQLATDTQNANAALGHQAQQLGVTSQALYGLQIAAQKAGSSASAVVGDVEKLNAAYEETKLTGDNAFAGPSAMLAKLGVKLTDAKGQLRSWIDIARDAANSPVANAMSDQDRYKALQLAGLSKDSADTFRNPNYDKWTREAQGLAPSKEATEAAQRLKNAWVEISEVVQNFVTKVLTKVEPYVTKIVGAFSGWYEANQKIISSKIDEFFGVVSDFFNKTDWSEVSTQLRGAGNDLIVVAKAIAEITKNIADFIRQTDDFKKQDESIFGKQDDGTPNQIARGDEEPNLRRLGRWMRGEPNPPEMHGAPDADPNAVRGIRNNNPLNLTAVPGQEGLIGSDGRFGVYKTMEDGISSDLNQLLLYQDRDKLSTVNDIISKWAPPSDNPGITEGYIAQVAKALSVKPTDKIDLHDQKVAEAMIAAMARKETGVAVDPGAIHRGVALRLAKSAHPAPATAPAPAPSPPATATAPRPLSPYADLLRGLKTPPAQAPAPATGPRSDHPLLSPFADLLRDPTFRGIPNAASFQVPATLQPMTNNNQTTSDNSSTVTTGDIHIHTRADSPNGIAEAVKQRLGELSHAAQAQGAMA